MTDLAIYLPCLVHHDCSDFARFPPEKLCEHYYRASEDWIRRLQNRQLEYPFLADRLEPAIQDARRLQKWWWAAWYVSWAQATHDQRVYWRDEARRLMGDDAAYFAGRWPPPLPYWWIPE